MTWFADLTGFDEQAVDDVAAQFTIDDEEIVSHANGRRMRVGHFETPSLSELRDRVPVATGAPTTVREVVADVQSLHCDPAHAAHNTAGGEPARRERGRGGYSGCRGRRCSGS